MSMFDPYGDFKRQLPDRDPSETSDWIDSLDSVVANEGRARAQFILYRTLKRARQLNLGLPPLTQTRYINTISPEQEPDYPGDEALELRIRRMIRWNAVAMVLRGNTRAPGIGGHLATYASAATLYEVGFNHFFRGKDAEGMGDHIFFQGHAAPGIYARAFLEGRFSESQLDHFRQEVVPGQGLSSYPHPRLMPDFWEFPTVSMGIGPLSAIYQARFNRYLHHRGIKDTSGSRVWAFLGDGECDEPESLGALSIASREQLDNLIFVINCNLQRLDGPVRGNFKIVQELEAVFRGAGWNVVKVLWGNGWDRLLEKDKTGLLQKRMDEVVDGEMQNYKANGAAYTREHFFGKYPELLELVSDMSDQDIQYLARGGHDVKKVYNAYHNAVNTKGQPTVVLAQTVKGYGMGSSGEAINKTHSAKSLAVEDLKKFRDRFELPIKDEDLEALPYYRPAEDSPEMQYMRSRRNTLKGYLPSRKADFDAVIAPELEAFAAQLKSTGEREISTTMSFVRILSSLVKDKQIGKQIVPIVPDEARTFGMEGMFKTIGIYSSEGQKYTPHDAAQMMSYHESSTGQILEEGINEAGSMASWIAAATAYSNYRVPMIPFYIYYSMFGFQRIGDLAWAAGDSQARGFLLGATAGRTTLNGEGLQHQDGHSHVMANTIPNCRTYDPTYAYELAVVIQDGIKRMYQDKENVFYYISLMNENYQHPDMPEGSEAGIIKGIYQLEKGTGKAKNRVQLLGAGTILREVRFAAEILRKDFDVEADVWSVTSVNELTRDGQRATRWNMLNPTATPRKPYVTQVL